MMKILFLHGWQSIVGGVKPTYLIEHGFEVLNPALDDDDFEEALQTAEACYRSEAPEVIVGSSRGGALAMNLDSDDTPLVLICPAWKRWGNARQLKQNSIILHSRQDDIVPFEDSVELLTQSNVPTDRLIEVGNDHRLADKKSLATLKWACMLFHSGKLSAGQSLDDMPISRPDAGDQSAQSDASYVCDACGEEIVIPLDVSEGLSQSYVEDCPVCCRANIIHVNLRESGAVEVSARLE